MPAHQSHTEGCRRVFGSGGQGGRVRGSACVSPDEWHLSKSWMFLVCFLDVFDWTGWAVGLILGLVGNGAGHDPHGSGMNATGHDVRAGGSSLPDNSRAGPTL